MKKVAHTMKKVIAPTKAMKQTARQAAQLLPAPPAVIEVPVEILAAPTPMPAPAINYGAVRIAGAQNTPVMNNEAKACLAIAQWASEARPTKPGLTPFGHKSECQGGLCDLAVIDGKAVTAFALLDYVAKQRHTKVIAGLWATYNDHATVISHLARRLQGHIKWCGNPDDMSHGGFVSRLALVGLESNLHAISAHFAVIAKGLPLYTKVDQVRLALAKQADTKQALQRNKNS